MSKLRIGPGVKVLDHQLKSIAEFENWKHSVLYNLRLDGDFKSYLVPGFEFGKKTVLRPSRSLIPTTGEHAKSAAERSAEVDFMLDQIAQFCPNIPHNDITRECGTLDEVWQVIRLYSNIETTGALLNDCWNITRGVDEPPSALFSRLKQAYDDNLIMNNTLKYKGAKLRVDEELSPTLHNVIILHWLQILHPKLRDLVTQRFGMELRENTYAQLFPEISKSIDNLLNELHGDISVCRYNNPPHRPSPRSRGSYPRPPSRSTRSPRECDYCRIKGKRSYQSHSIEDCLYLKREDYQQSREVNVEEAYAYDDHYDEYYRDYPGECAENRMVITEHLINRVSMHASPNMTFLYHGQPYDMTLDTGGTCSILPSTTANVMRCKIRHTNQRARMADGRSSLNVIGETDLEFFRNGKSYKFNALVCDVTDATILGGMPFMLDNDIAIRPAKSEIIIDGEEVVKYDPVRFHSSKAVCRVNSYTLHSPIHEVIMPGEATSYTLPADIGTAKSVAVEPRIDSSHNRLNINIWPSPKVCEVSEGKISLVNTSNEPVTVKKHEQICIIQTPVPDCDLKEIIPVEPPVASPPQKKTSNYSLPAQVNPDGILSKDEAATFTSLLQRYDEVFNPTISRYNGHSGACFVEVNMGPNPPAQHKGRVPFYGRNNLEELQQKFDVLTAKGVFRRPQDIGVTVEVVNPSFLVRKSSSNDKRLVTDFGQIAPYCRPTPTLMPDVDTTLRQIASWKFLIKSDLTEAYFQIPLKKTSMKYTGVVTPTKGILVYTAGCMGLPGTEVALEELTCLLFGGLVMQGKVAKLADDLFIGGATPEELCSNFEEVLAILLENNLRLSARKTIIAPKSVMILGWIWESGFLKASSHKLSALSECKPPDTITALKSYLGAYRFLSRVIRNYANLLEPLESMTAGKTSGNSKIIWSEEQLSMFRKAQLALRDGKAIVLPRPDDTLWIVTDAAVRPTAIGATLYAVRKDKTFLAGFYNARLPHFQQKWLPCELEGVAIGAALKHYAPYIIQSHHKPCVLTDSKACVEAVEKLSRGEYSSSSRLVTFLSQCSRYQALVKHVSGSVNLTSDFISRNPVTCTEDKCQICKFLQKSMSAVVASVTVSDIMEGRVHLPFINKRAWIDIQIECPDLRHLVKYLQNGTTPGKKGRNLRMVRRYITSKVVISAEGVLVVRQLEPLHPVRERIVVPPQALHGLLMVLHLKLGHPSSNQLHKVFVRYFFALNLDGAIADTSKTCHQCSAIKDIPTAKREESTDDPPSHVGDRFAADVIKRNLQNILILRECVSSYTLADLVKDETAAEISKGLLRLCNVMRPSPLFPITIRVDPAPANRSLFINASGDSCLGSQNIKLEVGRELNLNKNPVAEKSIKELIREILILSPDGDQLTTTTLSQAVANLNSRIRASGASAHEVFTQRDQATGAQMSLDDKTMIEDQYKRRMNNHKYSEKSKSGNKPSHPVANINAGDVVYLYDDGSKVKARPRYLVISVEKGWCKLKRFADKRLGSRVYSAKLTECYKVPDEMDVQLPQLPNTDDQSDLLITMNRQKDEIQSFPCSVCKRDVKEDDKALKCDTCLNWCHTECGNVTQQAYEEFLHSDESINWNCPPHATEENSLLEDHEESDNDDTSYAGEESETSESDTRDEIPPTAGPVPLERGARRRLPPDRLNL